MLHHRTFLIGLTVATFTDGVEESLPITTRTILGPPVGLANWRIPLPSQSFQKSRITVYSSQQAKMNSDQILSQIQVQRSYRNCATYCIPE